MWSLSMTRASPELIELAHRLSQHPLMRGARKSEDPNARAADTATSTSDPVTHHTSSHAPPSPRTAGRPKSDFLREGLAPDEPYRLVGSMSMLLLHVMGMGMSYRCEHMRCTCHSLRCCVQVLGYVRERLFITKQFWEAQLAARKNGVEVTHPVSYCHRCACSCSCAYS